MLVTSIARKLLLECTCATTALSAGFQDESRQVCRGQPGVEASCSLHTCFPGGGKGACFAMIILVLKLIKFPSTWLVVSVKLRTCYLGWNLMVLVLKP